MPHSQGQTPARFQGTRKRAVASIALIIELAIMSQLPEIVQNVLRFDDNCEKNRPQNSVTTCFNLNKDIYPIGQAGIYNLIGYQNFG